MPLALYMDQHVPRAITTGLRLRDVDVLTAFEDGASDIDDPELLDRASALGRVLFSQDDDLLTEAARRQAAAIPFSGVIYAHQLRVSIGVCIHDLELIATAGEIEDLRQQVLYLPPQILTQLQWGLIQDDCRTSASLSISRLAGLTRRLSVVST